MLKHCQATETRRSRRSVTSNSHVGDNASLNSSGSNSFNSSFGSNCSQSSLTTPAFAVADSRRSSFSSPEPLSLTSRTSSFASLSLDQQQGPKIPIKVYAKCLRPDIEYKTLSIGYQTTCKDLVWMLLAKYRMKHRDPNLFYLTMDIYIKRTGIPLKRTLVLEDDSRPAELKSCHPWGECKFTLQVRSGGLVRIHDSILMAESKYKCLLIAEHTTVNEVIKILFHCYGLERIEHVERYCIYEQCQSQCYERRLHPEDRPAQVQSLWPNPSHFMFVLKRSPSPCGSTVGSSSSNNNSPHLLTSNRATPTGSDDLGSPSPNLSSIVVGMPPRGTDIRHHLMVKSISIHESGLPSPPVLRPKTSPLILTSASNRASLGSLSSGSRSSSASFHDYENYFYI